METYNDTILIVDDNKNNLKVLQELLESQSYNIRIAMNGKGALASIQAQSPGLILLDIQLPDISGYDVCQQLKQDPKTRDIPIIFISALDDSHDKVKGFDLGAVDYVTKPFNSAELLARVKTHLTLHRLQYELVEINETLEQRVKERTEELEQMCDRLSDEINQRMSEQREHLWNNEDQCATNDCGNKVMSLLTQLQSTDLTSKQQQLLSKIHEIVAGVLEGSSK